MYNDLQIIETAANMVAAAKSQNPGLTFLEHVESLVRSNGGNPELLSLLGDFIDEELGLSVEKH